MEPVGAHLTALATIGVAAVFVLRSVAVLRLWGPVIGIVAGCVVAAVFGLYSAESVIEAPWVGLPSHWPGLGLDFGFAFWDASSRVPVPRHNNLYPG